MKKIFASFHYPQFRIYFIASAFSNFAFAMQNVAILWQLYELTKSPLALGAIGLVTFIPIFLFSMIGGVVADTSDRKILMVSAHILLAIFSAVFALTTVNQSITPTIIFIVLALSGAVDAFYLPARQSVLPTIVPKELFANAASLNTTMWQTSRVVGPAIAGFIIAAGTQYVYIVNTILFILALAGMLVLKVSKAHMEKAPEISLKSLKEGIRFALSQPLIYSTMILDFTATFFASASTLLPIYAADILHVGAQGLGILYAASSVGSVITGVIISTYHNMKNQGKVILIAVFFFGLSTALFSISNSFMLSVIFLAITGACDMFSMVIRNVIRQMITPDHIRGRLSGIDMIFFMGGPLLGETEAGVTAHLFGTAPSVVIGGLATMIITVLIAIYVPKLRKYNTHVAPSLLS